MKLHRIPGTAPNKVLRAAGGLEVVKTSGLEGISEAELDSLIGTAKCIHEPSNLIIALLDVSALKLDGDLASLAVGFFGSGRDDDGLIKDGRDRDDVLTGLEKKVVDGQISEELIVGIVVEGGVANIEGVVGWIRDGRGGVEVGDAVLSGADLDLHVGKAGAVEFVQARKGDHLVEIDVVLLGETGGLDLGLAVDGHANSLVLEEGLVELDKCIHIGNLNFLANVDSLELVGVGLGEIELDERSSTGNVAEGKVANEGVNISLDSTVGADCGVDLHGELVGFSVQDADALNPEVGIIDLGLSNVLDAHKDDNANDSSSNTEEDNQMKPPESLAMVLESGLLATANGTVLSLCDLVLVGHFR